MNGIKFVNTFKMQEKWYGDLLTGDIRRKRFKGQEEIYRTLDIKRPAEYSRI